MSAIYLVPVGSIEDEVMKTLEACLWQIFGFEVKRMPAMEDPVYAYDRQTQQYSSTLILKEILKNIPKDAVRVLGITDRDLFIPMLSFVFGHAQVNGQAAIISLARLRQEFYGLPVEDSTRRENRLLFLYRAMKEAVHELGHTFGLVHCADTSCAMSLSNTIQQVDRKTEELCKNCTILLEENVRQIIPVGRR